jgi:ankyrin repeat protein
MKGEPRIGKVCGKRVLACWTSRTGTQRVFLVDHEDGSFGWLCQYFDQRWRESRTVVCRSRYDSAASAGEDVFRNIPWVRKANEDGLMQNLLLNSEYEDALYSRDRGRFEAWLASGGSPFSELSDGGSILDRLIALGWTSTVRRFVEKAADLSPYKCLELLSRASLFGYCEVIELLAQYGVDVNEGYWGEPEDTPLQVAIGAGQTEAARTLVRHGARLPDDALTLAILSGNQDTVGFIIECGADVNRLDGEENPLFTAAETGNIEIAKLLLAHGAKVNPVAGWLPVEVAIRQRDKAMAGLLVERGAVVPDNLRDKWLELSQRE